MGLDPTKVTALSSHIGYTLGGSGMSAAYDVFLSHAWADGERPHQIAEALSKAGLRVWFDAAEINDFTSFVGRLKEMWEVHSLLHAGDVAQVSYATVATGGIARVSGLGGMGKSLLAEEYALHFGSAYPGGVFWLRAHGNDDAQTPLG